MKRWAAVLVLGCFAATAWSFDLQGHRGTRGNAPENTLAAFQRALEIGVTTLEMDAAITADGVVVVSHDPALNPAITRNADGSWLATRGPLIKSLTLAEVQAYDVGRIDPRSEYAKTFSLQRGRDGERIPTLAAIFAKVKELGADHVQFDIETKVFPDHPDYTLPPEEFVRKLLAVIREAGMTKRVMIQSFDWRTLELVQQLEPGLRTVYLTVRSRSADSVASGAWTAGLKVSDYPSEAHMVKAAGGSIWSPNFNALSEAAVKSAQELGVKVIPWTVNEPADIERVIGWGIDGIISDYPDRVRDVMSRRGMQLPPQVVTRH